MRSLLETVRVELTDARRARRAALATGLGLVGVAACEAGFALLGSASGLVPVAAGGAIVLSAWAFARASRPRVFRAERPAVEADTIVLRGEGHELRLPRASVGAAWSEDRDLVLALSDQRLLRLRTGHPDDARELRATLGPAAPRAAGVPLDALQLRRGSSWVYAMAASCAIIALLWALSLPGGVSPALVALAPLSVLAMAVVLLRRARGEDLILGLGEVSLHGERARIASATQADDELVLRPTSGGELHIDAGRPTTAEALAVELSERARLAT